jgi:polar amino acid transport system substrate-binding protein
VRKLLAVVVVALVAAGLGGCSSGDSGSGGGASPSGLAFTPARPGTLTVQTSLPAPGFWNGATPTTLTGGFEYELARRMAQQLGLELRVGDVDFGALVAGTTSGFDLALSQITKDPEREKVAAYSDGYFGSGQGVLVNKGTQVSNLDQAKQLQWGIQGGTTSERFLNAQVQPVKPARVYNDTGDLFAALLSHDVAAVLFDTVVLLPQSKQPGYEDTEVVGQFMTGEVYGVLMPKHSKNVATINTLLKRFERNGTINGLAEQYLAPDSPTGLGGDPSGVPAIPY